MANEYATQQEFIDYAFAHGEVIDLSVQQESNVDRVLEVVSRAIDFKLGTTFYARDETRYYATDNGRYVYVDDLIEITSLKTSEDGGDNFDTTWAASDYFLHPLNARASQLENERKPYRRIEISENGDNYFPTNYQRAIRLEGKFGYCEGINDDGDPDDVPPPIKEATLLMSLRLWKRPNAPYGVVGVAPLNVQSVVRSITSDKDVMLLLSSVSMRGGYYMQ